MTRPRRTSDLLRSSLLLLALPFVACVYATAAWADDLEVRDAWVRQPPPGANAAGYLVLVNTGDAPKRVVGVASDVAARTEIHRSWVEDGVAHMRRIDAIEVPPGAEVVLAPRGLHVMFIRPAKLELGQKVEIRFAVEGGGELKVEAEVRREPAGAGAHEHGAH